MAANPDCYFFTYIDDQGAMRIAPLCVDCRDKEPDKKAMFWEGSVKGYKPDARFACKHCGLVLHEPETDELTTTA